MLKLRCMVALARAGAWIMHRLGRQASTLPGRFLLRLDKAVLAKLAAGKRILAVSGTNGKTTTVSLTAGLLRRSGLRVVSNATGANLQSGLVTCLALAPKDTDVFVLEVDEAAWGACAHELKPMSFLVTNLFRDQLDRYGELAHVFALLRKGVEAAHPDTLILCADDPTLLPLADAAGDAVILYYGHNFPPLDENEDSENTKQGFSSDLESAICPRCNEKLRYREQTMAHMGLYYCPGCGEKRPRLDFAFSTNPKTGSLVFHLGSIEDLLRGGKQTYKEIACNFPLKGLYNAYNACAAVAMSYRALEQLNPGQPAPDYGKLIDGLREAKPSFGRQERFDLPGNEGKSLCLLLVKNPTGLEQGLSLLHEVNDLGAIVMALNSQPPDGCDISWIWDASIESYPLPDSSLYLSGERRGDLALRLLYAGVELGESQVAYHSLEAVKRAVKACPQNRCVYVLVNYTAMLNLRRALASTYGFSWEWTKEEDA